MLDSQLTKVTSTNNEHKLADKRRNNKTDKW